MLYRSPCIHIYVFNKVFIMVGPGSVAAEASNPSLCNTLVLVSILRSRLGFAAIVVYIIYVVVDIVC